LINITATCHSLSRMHVELPRRFDQGAIIFLRLVVAVREPQ